MRRSEKLLSYQVIFTENGPRRTGARGFPLFLLVQTNGKHTAVCKERRKSLYERKSQEILVRRIAKTVQN